MATFLFDQLVFGPVKSRRLGVSLGINLAFRLTAKFVHSTASYCSAGSTPLRRR